MSVLLTGLSGFNSVVLRFFAICTLVFGFSLASASLTDLTWFVGTYLM